MASGNKISVIVPVYNGEKNIEATLKNLLKSTYKNLEIVIVDDGSSDRSVEICKCIRERDERVVVFQKKNGGIADARNFGVEHATGDYLCFCDHDDFVEPEMYQKMQERLEKDQSDLCMCSMGRSIDGKKSLFEKLDDICYEESDVLKNLLYPLLFKGYNVPIEMERTSLTPCIWNCMFRMEFWKKYDFKFRAYVNFEDDMLVKIDTLSRTKRASTISYVGYYWNVNLQSETYAHKFVEDLANKQKQCYEDMEMCVCRCVSDKLVLNLFRQVTFCKQYLDAIHIITSPYKKKDIKYIQSFCKETMYERDFDNCIQAKKYVISGQIRAKVLLPLISKKMSITAYLAEKCLDYILWISLHSQTLTKLERIVKGIKPADIDN